MNAPTATHAAPARGAPDRVNPLAAALLPLSLCRRLGVVALALRDGVLLVGMADPTDRAALATVHEVVNQRVRVGVLPVPMDAAALEGELTRLGAPARSRARGPLAPWLGTQPVSAVAAEPPLAARSTPPPPRREAARPIAPWLSGEPSAPDSAPPAEEAPRDDLAAAISDAVISAAARATPAPAPPDAPLDIEAAIIRAAASLPAIGEDAPWRQAAPGRTPDLDRPAGADLLEPLAPPPPLRLGERLQEAHAAGSEDIEWALAVQARSGDPLGRILTHAGRLSEVQLAASLAEHLGLEQVDPSVSPDHEAVRLLTRSVALRHRVVALDVRDGRLRVAMPDPNDADAIAAVQEHTGLSVQPVVCTDTAVDLMLQRLYAADHVHEATLRLLENRPEESAYRVLSTGQSRFLIASVALFALVFALFPIPSLVALTGASVIFYAAFAVYRFRLIHHSLGHEFELPVTVEDVAALSERELPVYTILVPLFREAHIVPRLVAALSALDYPATRLDIKLLCEEDDEDTWSAVLAMNLPPQFRLMIVPLARPQTKPKACNYGLAHARGEYVVIYDAEDNPEPDQLKKVLAGFALAPDDVVCIQCKLNYYNRKQNLLTEWFTTEYSMWFDLFMPGLAAAEAPIPLGGTSNHFRRDVLLGLGAWDPFNVAEDADLGIRLAKLGMRTAIVDSTTYEEANSVLDNWLRQRSRWVKGYIQTWLVHMRHPVALWRALGPRRFLSFQLVVGGTPMSFLLNPVFSALTTLWVLGQADIIRQVFPSFIYYVGAAGLILGNFVFTYVNVVGSMARGYYDLVKFALFSPMYWLLMSVGAWKGLIQLFVRPHYWEKTVHGLDL